MSNRFYYFYHTKSR